MKHRCLIVDDEPLARELIRKYVNEIPELELAGECGSANEAIDEIEKGGIDLLFLDIKMPGIDGITMIRSLPAPPQVILITAYPEYAVEGFEIDAVDYLVKPVSFERFRKAVSKVLDPGQSPPTLSVKADKRLYRIEFNNILFISALGDYIKVICKDKTLITNETMKGVESKLPAQFIRIHKSHIVNLDLVEFVEGNECKIGGGYLPIGAKYKEEFLSRLK